MSLQCPAVLTISALPVFPLYRGCRGIRAHGDPPLWSLLQASPPPWNSNPHSSKPPLPFLYAKSIECNGFLNKWCSCSFSSNNFFLLINVKLRFNFIKCTDELLDSNEGWAWKYNSMLLLVISPKGDVFQGWKEFIKEKGDGGSQPLLTACCQFREKWNELSELKESVRGRHACSSLCTFSLEPQEDILMVQ